MTKERRSLVEGLKPDPELQKREEEFVFGAKRNSEVAKPIIQSIAQQDQSQTAESTTDSVIPLQSDNRMLPQITGRVPVTTRCRPEVASALKRASLQRQLARVEPYYVQDIMEVALETWLFSSKSAKFFRKLRRYGQSSDQTCHR